MPSGFEPDLNRRKQEKYYKIFSVNRFFHMMDRTISQFNNDKQRRYFQKMRLSFFALNIVFRLFFRRKGSCFND